VSRVYSLFFFGDFGESIFKRLQTKGFDRTKSLLMDDASGAGKCWADLPPPYHRATQEITAENDKSVIPANPVSMRLFF